MMKQSTLTKLNNLVSMLVANAQFCQRSDVEASKKSTLFEVLKYAIRKESGMIQTFWNINALSIAKTPRQLNYVASETEYKLRKLFRKNETLKLVWLPRK
jgi:hypothetical protein